MENPTTSTKTQENAQLKRVAEVVTADINTERCYTWDKSWVRPYESVLGVYMNFCSINALTYNDLLKIWQLKDGHVNWDRICRRAHCSIGTGYDFADKLIDLLIPAGLYDFPTIEGEITYRSTFHYCPECMKQGYHSLLSQIPSETVCPIHNIPYIDSRKYLQIGMRGEFNVYEKMLSIELPLPQEREELNYSKIEERIKEVISGAVTLGYSLPYSNEYYIMQKIKERYTEGKRELVSTIDGTIKYDDYINKVRDHFCSMALQTLEFDPDTHPMYYFNNLEEYIDHFWNETFLGSYYNIHDYLYRAEIMACMLEYVKDVDRDKWPGNFPDITTTDYGAYPSDDEVTVKASYCYAVRGNDWEGEIFSLRYLFIMGGSECRNTFYTYTTYLDRVEDDVNKAMVGMSGVGELSIGDLKSVAAVEVIHDHFWAQAARYEADIKSRKTFEFKKEWRNIEPLVYEYHQNEDGTVYIYRIAA